MRDGSDDSLTGRIGTGRPLGCHFAPFRNGPCTCCKAGSGAFKYCAHFIKFRDCQIAESLNRGLRPFPYRADSQRFD